MNIGIGLIAMVFAIIFLVVGVISHRNDDKTLGIGLLIAGVLALSFSLLLLSGIYDPYALL
ncbi:hypothetical protein [Bacillus sp. J33]|uniref:hypothetical protein n=1 Tax=Bacillus sp. J33 TaxID=935836 RepID=UPI00047EC49E|nr:hypothetical protein [Bacillus sp. J33]